MSTSNRRIPPKHWESGETCHVYFVLLARRCSLVPDTTLRTCWLIVSSFDLFKTTFLFDYSKHQIYDGCWVFNFIWL